MLITSSQTGKTAPQLTEVAEMLAVCRRTLNLQGTSQVEPALRKI